MRHLHPVTNTNPSLVGRHTLRSAYKVIFEHCIRCTQAIQIFTFLLSVAERARLHIVCSVNVREIFFPLHFIVEFPTSVLFWTQFACNLSRALVWNLARLWPDSDPIESSNFQIKPLVFSYRYSRFYENSTSTTECVAVCGVNSLLSITCISYHILWPIPWWFASSNRRYEVLYFENKVLLQENMHTLEFSARAENLHKCRLTMLYSLRRGMQLCTCIWSSYWVSFPRVLSCFHSL